MDTQQPQAPQQSTYETALAAEMQRRTIQMNLTRSMKNGANFFYWIAGLSVVNSLIYIFGGGVYFVIGLGITQFIDGFVGEISRQLGGNTVVIVLGLLFSLVFDVIFVVFGYFAGKGHRWAFIVGMILYGLDALIMLLVKEWFGLAFHVYFLYGIWTGFSALGKLKAFESSNPMAVPPAETMR